MNYWLTTHWPRRADEAGKVTRHIYLPDGRQEAGADLAPGDLVLIYESQSGRAEVVLDAAGEREVIPRSRGRGGIVSIGKVRRKLEGDADAEPTEYADGTNLWWRWYAPTDTVVAGGFVPRTQVNAALGYKEDYPLRGFGDRQSGLKKLTKDQFDRLADAYRASVRAGPKPSVEPSDFRTAARRAGGDGEESSEHLHLKEYVAAQPCTAFAEEGLSTLKAEYPFPTGDCADVVLEDRFGRLVGAEIEVHVGPKAVEGVLQAVKYRFMAPVLEGRNLLDSRAALVAYTISAEMKALCARYEVQCIEVDRKAVAECQHQRDRGMQASH